MKAGDTGPFEKGVVVNLFAASYRWPAFIPGISGGTVLIFPSLIEVVSRILGVFSDNVRYLTITCPLSGTRVWPVMVRAFSEERNTTESATSRPFISRLRAVLLM